MSSHGGDHLNSKQQMVLAQFRENVQDVLDKTPHRDEDYYLLRWLKARHFDLKKSEAMLRQHIAWRDMNDVDTILQDYQPPKVMMTYFPGGLFGHDHDNNPIWIDPVGNIDLKGILMSLRKQDVIKSKVWMMETIQRQLKEQSQKHGERIDRIVVIFDLENLGSKHLWKPGIQLFQELASTFECHYPELLKKAYLVNAPRIFPVIYNLLRPFLHEDTRRKVVVCGKSFKEVLLQNMDADQLPAHWGGSCVDSDGNPRCPSAIVLGGEVPPSCYGANNFDDVSSFTQISVGSGSSFQMELVVDTPHSAIRWQFKTDSMDIGFAIYRRTDSDNCKHQKLSEMEPVVQWSRVNSHLVPEDGSALCKLPGNYVVSFDNTYSFLKSKKLYYLVEVLEPSDNSPSCDNNNDPPVPGQES